MTKYISLLSLIKTRMEENCQITKIKYQVNPFIQETLGTLAETVKTKKEFVMGDKKMQNVIRKADTGEVVGETAMMRFKKVDTEQFTKIYCTKIKSFFNMTESAGKVFEYTLLTLEKNKDQIYLYEGDIAGYTGLSERSCSRAINVLIENKILARTVRPYWYFINPTLFFNGDRLALIDIYERETKSFEQKPLKENTNFLSSE